MLRVGTSGYSFPDWKGTIYPKNIKQSEMLEYYAHKLGFDTVEINFTYYRQPSPRTLWQMARKVPVNFEFTIKAHKEMTHDIFTDNWHIKENKDAFKQFQDGIASLVEENQLGCILFQFPVAFFPKPETKEYILKCRQWLPQIPLVIEFRNKAWIKDKTFDFLRENDLGYCCVDEPPLPRLVPFVPKVTSDIAYFRFHGRNTNWFNVPVSERYNYLYTDDELKTFVPIIESINRNVAKTYVFFNNCHAGSAAKNAKRIKELLGIVEKEEIEKKSGKEKQLGFF